MKKRITTTLLLLVVILGSASCSIFQEKHKLTSKNASTKKEQGKFDKNGEKTGEWEYYDNQGNLIKTTKQ